MNPLSLHDEGYEILGVNAIDINPAHQLFAFGIEGNGTVQFWDPRSRTRVGLLHLPMSRLLPTGKPAVSTLPGVNADSGPSVSATAIASRIDGLSYAIGTSTGHTLLYDIRSPRPSAIKDQGYGLPVKVVSWIEGGSRMAGDGLVLSADKKVLKIWDRHSVRTTPFTFLVSRYLFLHVAGYKLCLHHARFRYQRCVPFIWKWIAHARQRGHTDDYILCTSTGPCTQVV